ncbi:MAG: polyphenol oxidase family protein [Patescibacteria group bacterium]
MYQLDNLKKFSGLVHGFSDAKDGNMSFNWGEKESVAKNKSRFLSLLGIKPEDCVMTGVSHGNSIEIIDKSFKSRGTGAGISDEANADAIMTDEKGIFLMILTADCLPVVLYDPVKSAVALAHLSRINTPENFICSVVEKMKTEFGTAPENLIVGIGPCIHKESYVFSTEELRKRVSDEKIFKGFIYDLPDGKKSIDLVGYNVKELISAGVQGKNIEISEIDTFQNTGFFSHRRSVLTGSPEGRMAIVVGMK